MICNYEETRNEEGKKWLRKSLSTQKTRRVKKEEKEATNFDLL